MILYNGVSVEELVYSTAHASAYIALAMLLLGIAKFALDYLTPFSVDDQLSAKDNPAFGVSLIGYYLGTLIVYIGVTQGEVPEALAMHWALAIDFAWAVGGIVLLNGSRVVLDKLVLGEFSTRKELIEDRNVGMGAVEFATYIATALIIAGAMSGGGGGILTALAFFGLGQVTLIVLSFVYQKLTPYDFRAEIERDNVAAGVAYAGNIICVGVVLMRGTAGDFISWKYNLVEFGWYAAAALGILTIGRFAIDALLLPGRTLKQEIVDDRNVNAGYLEGGVLVGLAGVIAFLG